MIGILGGTGVTGSQVVAALKAKGADFTCIVRDPDAAKAKLGDDVNVVPGDLSDPASLDSAMEGIDTEMVQANNDAAVWLIDGFVAGSAAAGAIATADNGAAP